MSFVHLHVHSHYSLLDGLTKIDDLVAAAKADGAPAVALTDHGVMYGVIEFYEKCLKADIKPIIGVETYLAPASRHDRTTRAGEKNYFHLVLLAKNNTGYHNLVKLTSIAHVEGYYYRPRIDWEVLEKYSEGLIATSSCLAGEVPRLLLADQQDKALEKIRHYQKVFGKENFFLELQDHPEIPEQVKVNDLLIQLGKEHNIPLIVTNDVHYLRADDDEAQDILLCIQNGNRKEDTNRMSMMGVNFSFKAKEEIATAFAHVPEALENTVKIAEMCDVQLELGSVQLPHFEVPEGLDGLSYLRQLCIKGFPLRYGKTYEEIDQVYKERLDYELEVIAKMGWPSYFLIVADFVSWARSQGILVGPGRGSAAGSLVCYLTGITNLCPIEYNLIFERFLNPYRISMPDIDLDFADSRRGEVLTYVQNKYGHDHVAQIITFGTMAARAAVRDVGRVLNYPYDYCDKLSKTIPPMMKLKEALERSPDLRAMYREPEAGRIIDYALKLEGVARHSSVHACGVLITKNPLVDHVPIQYVSSSDKSLVSQYSLHPIEDLGLLKMDFLGLSNLTIIESAINIIKNTQGMVIDIDKIPLNDHKTYELFQKGETTGVFQFESSGMKRYLKELKPTEFEDIIAMVALYRPGPMEWIPDYIAGKHARKKTKYLHPKLEPILEVTYGVAVYQEQVLQIARALAGFSLGEADVLRKAVGKKIPELLAEQKEKFVEGCVKNGLNSKLAEEIFSFIEPFAGYGFNRSHAACYAMLGYQTAYLKANWPTEFMAALLTSDQQNSDRVAIEIEECRSMGITIQPPDLNESFDNFTVVMDQAGEGSDKKESKTIRFGLKAIKNVGEHISEIIISERKANGRFNDISDFLERINDKDLNRKSLESLIKAGALESFADRGVLLANVDYMIAFHKEAEQRRLSKQGTLFGATEASVMGIDLKQAPPASRQEKLSWEKELLGLYITEHPFSEYRPLLEGVITPLQALSSVPNGQETSIAGVVGLIKKIVTRKNESMIFVKLEDGLAVTELIIFPKLLNETSLIWETGKVILAQGSLSDKDGERKILVNRAVELTSANSTIAIREFKPKAPFRNSVPKPLDYRTAVNGYSPKKPEKSLTLIISNPTKVGEVGNDLKDIFASFPGTCPVFLNLSSNGETKILKTNYLVEPHEELLNKLRRDFSDVLKIKTS